MTSFRDEHAFSRVLVKHFKARNHHVTPIESHIVPGIPDLHVVTKSGNWWFELKRIKMKLDPQVAVEVPWRSGQQIWAWEYWKRIQSSPEARPVFTLVAFNNCMLQIPMVDIFHQGFVEPNMFGAIWQNVTDIRLV
jgi:hypothetical protein